MSSHLYNTTLGRIAWFTRRFGASELILKPLRLIFGRWILPHIRPETFFFQEHTYNCYFALYNMTWVGERMVELPIAARLLDQHKANLVLEVGNVLSHYFRRNHIVVDKYEIGPGVINIDILDFNPLERFDLILSISTFEHIGFDDDTPSSSGQKIIAAISHCRSLLSDTGRLVITFPTGYNTELDALVSQKALGATRMSFLNRVGPRQWKECDLQTALTSLYRSRFPYGNALVVAEFSKSSP